jgi:hypothetical protein
LDAVDLLVLDTDGGWEQADSLKTAYDGAPETGFGSSPTRSTRSLTIRAL